MSPAIKTAAQLEELLSEPSAGAIEAMGRLEGDLLLLGVAGKMGPSLARMAKRASELAGISRRIAGVSRFSGATRESELQSHGIETIRCDLLDEDAAQKLPDFPNVIYLAGMKFGATGQESLTWAMNTYVPAVICRKFSRSKIVAFSTGNVYGLVPAATGGSVETDPAYPIGDYAMSCLGRERMFEHFSRVSKIPVALIRLNYACELRYGVLVDLALQIMSDKPVDLSMGWFNIIWQADACAMALQCFDRTASPPGLINVTGPEVLSVRDASEKLARRMHRPVSFTGVEASTALLSNAQAAFRFFGRPRVSADELITWVADWVANGGATLGKPTHFESREGKF